MPDFEPIVPPGQSPPFSTITTTDHSAWIIISTALGLCMSLLFAAIRIFIRSATKLEYGKDDYVLAAATVLASIQSVVLLSSCGSGLGKSKDVIDQQSLRTSEKVFPRPKPSKVRRQVDHYQKYYASNVLFVVVVSLSKASVACFLLQLTPVTKQKRFIHLLLGITMLWGLTFLFAVIFACDLPDPWIWSEQRCTGYFLRWQIMESIGCALELATFSSAVWLVWDLRTSRSNKTLVVIAFGLRLLIIAIVALRLSAFNKDGPSDDPTIEHSQFITWTSAELHYSLVSATIPILRSFVSNLSTNYGAGQGPGRSITGQDSTGSYGRSVLRSRDQNSKSREFELRSMNVKPKFLRGTIHKGKEHFNNMATNSSAYSPSTIRDMDAGSTGSNESQKMIIRKDVTWQVRRDNSNP